MPISTGVMSRTPSKNAGREKYGRIGRKIVQKRTGRLETSPNIAIINPRLALDASEHNAVLPARLGEYANADAAVRSVAISSSAIILRGHV
jgi:hypothetical protein